MKTAVEWLGNEITNRITRRNPHDTIIIQTLGEVLIELIEQAKEMEKEQILQSYEHGQNNGYMYRDGNSNIIQAQQYYNETFKSEK
jgi:hypothetical protein